MPQRDASLYAFEDDCCAGKVGAKGVVGEDCVIADEERSVMIESSFLVGLNPTYSGVSWTRRYVEKAPGCSDS
jgi:hypothetical protein